ncbi:helix-turn-helix domain-containing protein [Roseococcus sp. DSY-14]|uniref:helix-turn-helix domain-containing protein n=1 Tax=Roseococcus sp. DSY-14 TaxID=3369650 RepID=UPI00387B3AD9
MGPQPLVFDTASLPPRDRVEAWRARHAFWMDVTPLDAPDGFGARSETWSLGPLVLSWNSAGAARNVRGAQHVRRDQLDHYGLIRWRRGAMHGRASGADFAGQPLAPSLFGLQQPMEGDRSPAEWLMAFVPRDWVADATAGLDAQLGQAMDTPGGRLLGAHLDQLARELPHLAPAELPLACEATRLLLRAAARPGGDAAAEAAPVIEATQRARLRQAIRREIGSARLNPGRLAQLSGVSRSRLYRLFEAEGGVAKVILAERLRAVRRALADPLDRRSIASIAEAAGMPDPSAFGRAFRRDAGLSPGAFRAAALSGQLPADRAPAPADLRDALLALAA